MAIMVTFALTACGGGDKAPAKAADNKAPAAAATTKAAAVDLKSDKVQPMSEKRATAEKLTNTISKWLEGQTMFPAGSKFAARTYEDFEKEIGVPATEYYFDKATNARCYVWVAEGSKIKKFQAWFKENGGKWTIYATGSANLI